MKILKQIRGRPIEFGGEEHDGWLPPGAALPLSTPITNAVLDITILEETEGGFILEWVSRNTSHSNDSWHKTIEDAKTQAEYLFGIKPSEWDEFD